MTGADIDKHTLLFIREEVADEQLFLVRRVLRHTQSLDERLRFVDEHFPLDGAGRVDDSSRALRGVHAGYEDGRCADDHEQDLEDAGYVERP